MPRIQKERRRRASQERKRGLKTPKAESNGWRAQMDVGMGGSMQKEMYGYQRGLGMTPTGAHTGMFSLKMATEMLILVE
jgi:hypothetical protein